MEIMCLIWIQNWSLITWVIQALLTKIHLFVLKLNHILMDLVVLLVPYLFTLILILVYVLSANPIIFSI